MFLNIKEMFFKNYPEEYKDDFIKKVEHSNYARGKYFSYVIFGISFLMFLIALFAKDDDIIKKANFMLLIESFICSALFTIHLPINLQTSLFKRLVVYFEVLIVIVWSSSLLALIPKRIEFLAAYAMIIISISALMFLKWQSTLTFYSLSAICIMAFSKEYLIDPVLPKITTLIFLIIVAWLISRLLYIKEIDSFIANQRLHVSEQKAKMANSVKTDFLARMSHDMRTPLTALIGLSEFGIEEHKNDRDFEYFTKIKDSSEYLLSLVNDTLDLQKLEYSNIELDYTVEEISSVTKKVLTIIGHEAYNRGVNMVVDTESSKSQKYVMTDIKRLEQVLINILGNALKYTPKGGTVTWVNTMVNLDNEDMIVRNIITDNGVGMSQEFVKHMYEPFSKEYNLLSNGEISTGLGLAICKNLIETMGGSIECESELGKGTKFTV
ncbi:MAG: HAMP domain-containing histidine kinase, partial [Peptostreptococcaceae bacterium]|nr:HAMP domain-containing histidine kinase [Peptostreptococcaceae bacterium]